MMNDLSLKIKRSKERLLLTQMEQAAAAGMSKQQQEEVEMKIQILTDKINHLVDQAEKAGCQVYNILTRHFLFYALQGTLFPKLTLGKLAHF